jgi:hypothetical protein
MSETTENTDTPTVSSSGGCAQAESEPKHTPGPWHVPGRPWYDDNRSAVFSEADPNAGKLICANQHARFNPEQYEDGEVKANAKLIAAAPALFRACKAVLDCDMRTDEKGNAYLKVPARSLNDLGAQIHALVERAEGEA